MTKLTTALLRKAARIAAKSRKINAELTAAFNERYGCTYSDVDCDSLIDILDYGLGETGKTLRECDRAMALCGIHPIAPQQCRDAG